MTRDARAGLVGAVFGLVFIGVNAGDLGPPWRVLVRVLGIVAFLVVLVALARSRGGRALPDVDPAGWRLYLAGVAFEVVALVAGLVVINRSGHPGLAVPWVATVVGLHFLPLARAFHARFFVGLAAVLILLGVGGGVLSLAGAADWSVALVSGVLSGTALLATALLPALPEPVHSR